MLRREIRELRLIANTIDEHARLGRPYSLTFYNHENHKEPITDTQREELESYLEYHFREIWAYTWLHIESDSIRKVIGEPLKHE